MTYSKITSKRKVIRYIEKKKKSVQERNITEGEMDVLQHTVFQEVEETYPRNRPEGEMDAKECTQGNMYNRLPPPSKKVRRIKWMES